MTIKYAKLKKEGTENHTCRTTDPKYVTFEDSLGNSFILNNDWVNDWEYFSQGDVLTSLQGLVSYRLSGQVTFTINPRLESDFTFQE